VTASEFTKEESDAMDERTKQLAREIFIRASAQKVAEDSEYQQQTDFEADAESCFEAAEAFLIVSDGKS
jgi:hypothetical protein